MTWKVDRYGPKPLGYFRVSRFLWFPKRRRDIWRWLEWASWYKFRGKGRDGQTVVFDAIHSPYDGWLDE